MYKENSLKMDAKKVFLNYLKEFNLKDEKIRLKAIHTFGVVKAVNYIASDLNLGQEDREIANLIALLHDIGRFEQLRKFHTFDDSVMPHAQCSIDILFRDGMIREFIKDQSFDSIIYDAIRLHGVYRVEDSMYQSSLGRKEDRKRVILHTKLIRDADKVDNFRVKSKEPVETMMDVDEKTLGKEVISPGIYNTFMSNRPIKNSDRITHMDMWVSYLGYLFDFNFDSGLRYILEKDYINRIVDRIPYSNGDTKQKMEVIRMQALSYSRLRAERKGGVAWNEMEA